MVAPACAYCGLPGYDNLGYCPTAKKYFCNGKCDPNGSISSHILLHWSMTKTPSIILPSTNGILQCSICSSNNVFELQLISKRSGDQSNIVVCGTKCIDFIRKNASDESRCEPVVNDGYIHESLIKKPTTEMQALCKRFSPEIIRRLEGIWKIDPLETMKHLLDASVTEKPKSSVMRFASLTEYAKHFCGLTELEAQAEKSSQESITISDAVFHWEMIEDRTIAHLLKADELAAVRWSVGMDVKLIRDDESEKVSRAIGRVIRITDGDVLFNVVGFTNLPKDNDIFRIRLIFCPLPFQWMQAALKDLTSREAHDLPQSFKERLLGKETTVEPLICSVPESCGAPNLPTLNTAQNEAVQNVLTQPVCLVQGPPGTGKTVTAASIVYQVIRAYKQKVLAVAPSNSAADELCQAIEKTGLKVIRVVAKCREDMDSPVRHLMSHVKAISETDDPTLLSLHKRRCENFVLNRLDQKRYEKLRRIVEDRLLSEAEVICATCITAGNPCITRYRFHTVLIDESAQAKEPECLISMLRATKQVIMVGDHCQLGPVLKSETAERGGLGRSLYERLVILGMQTSLLTVQYRMHPGLSKFPSMVYYAGRLRDGLSLAERLDGRIKSLWPNPAVPTIFYCVNSEEIKAMHGTSFFNPGEASAVEKFLSKLLRAEVPAEEIGVITPYEGQRDFLTTYLRAYGSLAKSLYDKVDIASVNGFQGREKDYIIVSFVRSNPTHKIGFLNDPRRLNVAMTRARYGLIIIGDISALGGHPLWDELIYFYHDQNLLVRGPLERMLKCKPTTMRMSEHYKFQPK